MGKLDMGGGTQLKSRGETVRKRSAKGEKRRAEIVAAAVEIFSREGYRGASIASVAAQVGLTLPGLLHYFPSKVDLLLEVLAWRDRQSERSFDPDVVHWQALLDQLLAANRANAGIPDMIRVFSVLNAEGLSEDHPAHDWFRGRFDRITRMMAGAFARGIEAGEVRPDCDPEGLAVEIVAVMDGLQVAWLRAPEKVDLVQRFEAYVARLKASIAVTAV
ncbi:TetR/AcrR family transcriptional regulator [Martelella alba]|nr:TetR/AcrR family transcriptional regulator [Martelella alba]